MRSRNKDNLILSSSPLSLSELPRIQDPLVDSFFMIEHHKSLWDPLLHKIATYTVSCLANEAGDADTRIIMTSHKGHAVAALHGVLRSKWQELDVATLVASILQLAANEWYWGSLWDLRAHLKGLREIVNYHGGLGGLGMNGLLAQVILM